MEFFDGMAQKTKNISEIMKLTAAVSSEKERQEKIYRDLGETYYKVYGDRAESELMEMCTQIRESRDTVETYEKEILALKGIAVCPACGYEVSIHFNFCNNCGHRMKEIQEEQPSVDELIQEGEALRQEEEVLAEKEEEAADEDRIVKEILEEEAFAAKESVEEILAEEKAACESEQEPVNVPCEPDTAEEVEELEAAETICEPEAPQTAETVCEPEAPQTADEVCEPEEAQCAEEPCEPEEVEDLEEFFLNQIQEAVNVSSEKVCKGCGAQMEADQEFCIMCGAKYGETCREEAEEKEEEPQERICPKCGSIVKPGHLFCMECGTKQ